MRFPWHQRKLPILRSRVTYGESASPVERSLTLLGVLGATSATLSTYLYSEDDRYRLTPLGWCEVMGLPHGLAETRRTQG